MGMATPLPPPETPKPRYKGTIVCHGCHAEYRDGAKWWRVRYHGTQTGPEWLYRLPKGKCPFCGDPEKKAS